MGEGVCVWGGDRIELATFRVVDRCPIHYTKSGSLDARTVSGVDIEFRNFEVLGIRLIETVNWAGRQTYTFFCEMFLFGNEGSLV